MKPVKITGLVTFSRYTEISVDCLMGHVGHIKVCVGDYSEFTVFIYLDRH